MFLSGCRHAFHFPSPQVDRSTNLEFFDWTVEVSQPAFPLCIPAITTILTRFRTLLGLGDPMGKTHHHRLETTQGQLDTVSAPTKRVSLPACLPSVFPNKPNHTVSLSCLTNRENTADSQSKSATSTLTPRSPPTPRPGASAGASSTHTRGVPRRSAASMPLRPPLAPSSTGPIPTDTSRPTRPTRARR